MNRSSEAVEAQLPGYISKIHSRKTINITENKKSQDAAMMAISLWTTRNISSGHGKMTVNM